MIYIKNFKNKILLIKLISIFFIIAISIYASKINAQEGGDTPQPKIIVSGLGSQLSNISLTGAGQEFELGGVISIILKDAPPNSNVDLRSIKFTETGSLSNDKFNNLTVNYIELDDDGECSTTTPPNPNTLGVSGNFDDGANTITVNTDSPITLENDRRNCFYLKYSLNYNDYNTKKADFIGKSIKFIINNPLDIAKDNGDIGVTFNSESRVELLGNTIIGESDTSTLSLKKNDQDIIFFVDEGVLYKSVDNTKYRLTPAKIYVHDMSFKNMSPVGSLPLIEISLALRSADENRIPYGRIQYFKTTIQIAK